MSRQSGNFLLQALLALALIFAFIPFFASRISSRDVQSRMYSVTRAVDAAATAARIYIRENASNIKYDTTVVGGNEFVDLLEPYGLPLGFSSRTALGQDISLVINKDENEITAYLELTGGDVTAVQCAELARRIGFYAVCDDTVVAVGVALGDNFSDIVRRNEADNTNNAFLNDLDMCGFVFDNAGRVMAHHGEFDSVATTSLSIDGVENGRKVKSKIDDIAATRAVFQTANGEAALTLVRGDLIADSIDARTIARFGDAGNFTAQSASLYEFSMTAGRTGFTGPNDWQVRGNLISDRVTFSVERLDVSAYINVARGQDVYVNDELEYSSRSGIETGVIMASNITMRDQTSDALSKGGTGAVILDIRPAGVSVLPDVYIGSVNNDEIKILKNPSDSGGDTLSCKEIISRMGAVYNQNSLAQNIICQYEFWRRLEKRIDIKQCLLAGRGDCE